MVDEQHPDEVRQRPLRLLCDPGPPSLGEELEVTSLAPETVESALESLSGELSLASCRLTRLLSSGWVSPASRERVLEDALALQGEDGFYRDAQTTPAILLALLDLGVGRSAATILRAADALLSHGPLDLPALRAVRLTGRAHDTRVEYALQTLELARDGDLDDQLLRVACLLEDPFENRLKDARHHLRHLGQRVLRGERPTPRAARSLRGIPERDAALIVDLSLRAWLLTRDSHGLMLGDPEVTCDVALALRIHELDQPA